MDSNRFARTHGPAFLFDLDGTLVDSVYQHVLAWRQALEDVGIELAVWRIHRRIGMSGGLLVNALLRETGQAVDAAVVARLQERHAAAYMSLAEPGAAVARSQGTPGDVDSNQVPWAIATSGRRDVARPGAGDAGGAALGPDRDA